MALAIGCMTASGRLPVRVGPQLVDDIRRGQPREARGTVDALGTGTMARDARRDLRRHTSRVDFGARRGVGACGRKIPERHRGRGDRRDQNAHRFPSICLAAAFGPRAPGALRDLRRPRSRKQIAPCEPVRPGNPSISVILRRGTGRANTGVPTANHSRRDEAMRVDKASAATPRCRPNRVHALRMACLC